MKPKLIEGGHYYTYTGPTIDSHIGMNIAQMIKKTEDKIILFIDDIHTSHTYEDNILGCGGEEILKLKSDYHILESETVDKALELCHILQAKNKGEDYYYKGIKLTKNKGTMPTCIAMDSILTILKWEKGFDNLVNILPINYKNQQEQLQFMLQAMKYKNILPDTIKLLSILFSGYKILDYIPGFKQQIKETFYPSYNKIGSL